MQVRAIAAGFYGHYREIGDVFEVPSGTKATWFAPAKQVAAEAPKTETPAGGNSGQSLV